MLIINSLQIRGDYQWVGLQIQSIIIVMSKGLCDHLLSLKAQKIANYFSKASRYCSGNKKHSESERLGICLTCGVVRCDDQQNKCTFQHHYGTKHPTIFQLMQSSIYCFHCEVNIGQLLQQAPDSNKKDKLMEQFQKVMKVSDRIGDKAEQRQKVIKKEKKQTIYYQQVAWEQKVENSKKLKQQHPQKLPYNLQVFGLKNLGNTCFFNSILQCLYACEQLHSQYIRFKMDTDKQFGKIGQINILFNKYLRVADKHFSPKSLFSWVCKMKGSYRHMDQQDSQQLLALLVNGLIDGERFWMDVKQIHGDKITPSEKLFGFFLASRLECLACEKVNWTIDFSLQLAVQLAKGSSTHFNLPEGKIPSDQIKGQDLFYPPDKLSQTFLDMFFAPQSLSSKNYFECEKCQAEKAWRKFYIKDPPQILTISLKRFNNNLSKNNAVVRAPSQIDLQGHCINKGPLLYELFAITQHGGTSRGGHYVAHSKRCQNWYYFSDSTVKGESWQKALSCQPYVLFYKRIQ